MPSRAGTKPGFGESIKSFRLRVGLRAAGLRVGICKVFRPSGIGAEDIGAEEDSKNPKVKALKPKNLIPSKPSTLCQHSDALKHQLEGCAQNPRSTRKAPKG